MSTYDGGAKPLTREVVEAAIEKVRATTGYEAPRSAISPKGAAAVRNLLRLPEDWPITEHDLAMAVQVLYDRATEEDRIAMLRAALTHGGGL